MWIIPKNLPIYHSAQGMAALISDYSELSQQLEQSVLWRSKVTRSKTWLRRLNKGCSISLQFTQMLKPSLGNILIKKWISSVEVSLVSLLVPPAEDQEIKTKGTYSHTSSKASEYADLPLFSWKMLRASSVQNSKATNGQIQKAHRFCNMCSVSWKDWVTAQRRAYSQRLRSVHHTDVNECLYLVSEMNSQSQQLIMSTSSLKQQNQNKLPIRQQEELSNIGMSRQESPWATPIASDCFLAGAKKQVKDRKDGRKRLDKVPLQVLHQEKYKGKLNPRWVEMLMGVPIGWTMWSCTHPLIIEQMNSDCSATELCPTPPKPHLSQCGKNWSTPQARDFKGKTANHKDRGYGQTLPDQIE